LAASSLNTKYKPGYFVVKVIPNHPSASCTIFGKTDNPFPRLKRLSDHVKRSDDAAASGKNALTDTQQRVPVIQVGKWNAVSVVTLLFVRDNRKAKVGRLSTA
jgi:hypothetical protein